MESNILYYDKGDTVLEPEQWRALGEPLLYVKQGELAHNGHFIRWYAEVAYGAVVLEVDGKQIKGEFVAVDLPYCVLCGSYYGCGKDEPLFFIRAGERDTER